MIERFNKTFKSMLVKAMDGMDRIVVSAKLIDDLISNYNNTVHRMTGFTPYVLHRETTEDDVRQVRKKNYKYVARQRELGKRY